MDYHEDVSHTGDATLIRRVNASAVIELIREQGPITRAEVARALRLSLPTITRIVTELIDQGLVREEHVARSGGGRRPSLLEFNVRSGLVIGVYIGRNIDAALADLNGAILSQTTVPAASGAAGVARLVDVIEGLCAHARELNIPVRGAGIGVPSIVEYPRGVVVLSPMLDWRDLELRQHLEGIFDFPVLVQNEIDLLTLGESWRGAGRNLRNVACISLGAGIGAGLVIDGQAYSGAHYASGEIGYLVPDTAFLGKSFQTYGCLEWVSGSHGIVRRAKERISAGGPSVLRSVLSAEGRNLTVDEVFAAARTGDLVALSAVREAVDYWSLAIANLACLVDPARIIITGELAVHGDMFLEQIRERIRGLVPAMPDIVVSDLGVNAAVLGAVRLVMRDTSGAVFVYPSRA